MRIAIATDFYSPWVGGPATFIENFAAFLAGTGHRVEIIAPSHTGRPTLEWQEGLLVHRLPTLPLPVGHKLRVSWRWEAARAALLASRPDVLQVHHPFPLSLAVVRAARVTGIPIVAVNHTIPECSLYGMRDLPVAYPLAVGAFRRYLVEFLRRADAICTPTETAASLLRSMGLGRPIEVISNGIDADRFAPAPERADARRELGLPARPTVLYTGRLDAEKDMTTWVRAGAYALAGADAQLVIGGEGTERPALTRLVRRLGLADRVIFPGYLPAAQLPRLYQAADIYCMTSAVELQSISTLEALASGLPVVAARARALPELVEDGVNGYLAPPGDHRAFGEALLRLLQHPERASIMGAAGRRRAEGHSLHVVATRHLELLEATARRRGRRARSA